MSVYFAWNADYFFRHSNFDMLLLFDYEWGQLYRESPYIDNFFEMPCTHHNNTVCSEIFAKNCFVNINVTSLAKLQASFHEYQSCLLLSRHEQKLLVFRPAYLHFMDYLEYIICNMTTISFSMRNIGSSIARNLPKNNKEWMANMVQSPLILRLGNVKELAKRGR